MYKLEAPVNKKVAATGRALPHKIVSKYNTLLWDAFSRGIFPHPSDLTSVNLLKARREISMGGRRT
jgi:hypothetical protein